MSFQPDNLSYPDLLGPVEDAGMEISVGVVDLIN